MRIGLLTACYEPVTNGVTRMVALYVQTLQAFGHEPTVFTLGPREFQRSDGSLVVSPGVPLGRSGYFAAAGYRRAAQKALNQMDILHAHHLGMGIEFARRYSERPLVYTNHTRYDLYAEVYTPLWPPRLARETGRLLAGHLWSRRANVADVIIAPTAEIGRTMRRFGVSRPIVVIPNGIERASFVDPPDPFNRSDFSWGSDTVVGVYCGRLAVEKNLDTLLAQFAAARKEDPRLRLLLIGDGPTREKLRIRARELGLTRFVHMTGQVAFEEVANYLAAADFFVTSSRSEVDPLTVIEAMAAGLPILAFDCGWARDTVPPEAGLLAGPDPRGLAAGMVDLAGDAGRRHALGQEAARRSLRRDFNETARKTIALYEALLTGNQPALDQLAIFSA